MPMELIQGRGFGLEQSGAGSLRIVESEAEREAEMLGEREQAALPGGLGGWLVGLIRRASRRSQGAQGRCGWWRRWRWGEGGS